MSLRLGDTVPNFKANTTIGEIDFYEYLSDGWGVLFSHPRRLYSGLYYRTRQNSIFKK